MWNTVQGYPGFLWTQTFGSPGLLRPVTERWSTRGVAGRGILTFLRGTKRDGRSDLWQCCQQRYVNIATRT